ncbi:MAG: redox-sensing transcriptional repressor Rex [Oscillospiraceae bacterium]|nr:redox-sensing transcriptional repressor Rex [Ruminococcus sp.]MDE6706903.1 redox-sensing transcriptional repressor Rex [Oscillospiraceae bacterium]
MGKQVISTPVIRRLPRYYRFLGELEQEGLERISSRELALRMGFSASQIRQDFNCFGGFGQQGYGYQVVELRKIIGDILGVHENTGVILIGAGNLGKTIASHVDFQKRGCKLIAVFDDNPLIQGTSTAGLTIMPMESLESFCKQHCPQVAVLCIPKNAAQQLADRLINLGISGFWNFSHFDLKINNPDVIVENVHLGDSLMTLAYCMHRKEEN